jgi:hypothetical protein
MKTLVALVGAVVLGFGAYTYGKSVGESEVPAPVATPAATTIAPNFISPSTPDTSTSDQQSSGGLSTFSSEDDAQAHCPDLTVVWLNLNSGIYHMKAERWYGATNNGAYVCQQEADAAGDRATENGQ